MALWNSGSRISSYFEIESPRLVTRSRALLERDRALRTQYGTQWPGEVLAEFVQEERALRGAYDRLEDLRLEPWFPEPLISAIDEHLVDVNLEDARLDGKITTLDTHPLLQQLFSATEHLVTAREAAAQGKPVLTSVQRARLEAIGRAVSTTIRACGPNVLEAQRLIGGWAEGLLNGLTLQETVNALCVLDTEIHTRLHQSGKQSAHRQTDHALYHFCRDVLIALTASGEHIRRGAGRSSTVCLIRILLQAAGERVPRDLKKKIAAADGLRRKEVKRRRKQREQWAEHFPSQSRRLAQ